MLYYCFNGLVLLIFCDLGKYCLCLEFFELEFDCEVGYYCVFGVKEVKFIDGVIGDICLNGMYCLRGSGVLKNCLIGIFLNSIGNR